MAEVAAELREYEDRLLKWRREQGKISRAKEVLGMRSTGELMPKELKDLKAKLLAKYRDAGSALLDKAYTRVVRKEGGSRRKDAALLGRYERLFAGRFLKIEEDLKKKEQGTLDQKQKSTFTKAYKWYARSRGRNKWKWLIGSNLLVSGLGAATGLIAMDLARAGIRLGLGAFGMATGGAIAVKAYKNIERRQGAAQFERRRGLREGFTLDDINAFAKSLESYKKSVARDTTGRVLRTGLYAYVFGGGTAAMFGGAAYGGLAEGPRAEIPKEPLGPKASVAQEFHELRRTGPVQPESDGSAVSGSELNPWEATLGRDIDAELKKPGELAERIQPHDLKRTGFFDRFFSRRPPMAGEDIGGTELHPWERGTGLGDLPKEVSGWHPEPVMPELDGAYTEKLPAYPPTEAPGRIIAEDLLRAKAAPEAGTPIQDHRVHVARGDSPWSTMNRFVKANVSLDGLTPEEKVYVTDLLTKKLMAANPEQLAKWGIDPSDLRGFKNGQIIGRSINYSGMLRDQALAEEVFGRSNALTPAQLKNLEQYTKPRVMPTPDTSEAPQSAAPEPEQAQEPAPRAGPSGLEAVSLKVQELMRADAERLFGERGFFGIGKISGIEMFESIMKKVGATPASAVLESQNYRQAANLTNWEFKRLQPYMYQLWRDTDGLPTRGHTVESYIKTALEMKARSGR